MKLLHSKIFVIFLIVVFIFSVIAFSREFYRSFTVSQQINNLENKIKELKKENNKLSQMENYLQSEDFLQKEARIKLNLTKPGEKLIIVKTPEQTLNEKNEGQKLPVEKKPNIKLWWEYFFEK